MPQIFRKQRFFRTSEDHTLRKHNFVNSINVENDYKLILFSMLSVRPWIMERTFLTPFMSVFFSPQPSMISLLFHISKDFIGEITRMSKFSH